jgi:hypothetical protein
LCWVVNFSSSTGIQRGNKKEIALSSISDTHTLTVHNVQDAVALEGYEGTTIVMEIEKVIKADNKTQIEIG